MNTSISRIVSASSARPVSKSTCGTGGPHSPTHQVRQTEIVGVDRPMLLIVPPGVVHAYKNVGSEPGLVFNCPDRLYKGPGRKEPVDEIRHEDQTNSPYQLD